LGFAQHFDDPVPLARAYAFASLLTGHRKVIYTHDRIAGSIRGCMRGDLPISDAALTWANGIVTSYGANSFLTNADHFAPDYETFLAEGVAGTLARIRSSKRQHQEDPDAVKKQPFLDAAEIAMLSFGTMVGQYGDAAAALAAQVSDPIHKTHLSEIARAAGNSPQTNQTRSRRRSSWSGWRISPFFTKAAMPWRWDGSISSCIRFMSGISPGAS